MPIPEALVLGGSVLGFAAVSYATFVTVSYLEVKNKIDQQIAAGEDPYQLQTQTKKKDRRNKPPQKKNKNRK